MTDTLARLAGPSAMSSGDNTVLTVPASHIYTIRDISVVNRHAGLVTFKIGVVGSVDGDLFLPPRTLDLDEEGYFGGVLTLAAGETLILNASGTGLTVTVSGLDQGP